MRGSMKRLVRAVSDFRSFDGYTVEELEEFYPDYLDEIGIDVDGASQVYIPRNPNNEFVAIEYNVNDIRLYRNGQYDCKVSFGTMYDVLSK